MELDEGYIKIRASWRQRVLRGMWGVVLIILIAEILNFLILYHSGHVFMGDSILGRAIGIDDGQFHFTEYVVFYIILPSLSNISFLVLATIIDQLDFRTKIKNMAVIWATIWPCFIAATVHSYFLACTGVFVTPVFAACMMDEDKEVYYTVVLSGIMMILSSFIAPVFDNTWSFRERSMNLIVCFLIFILLSMICVHLLRFSKRKNRIIISGYQIEDDMRDKASQDMMTGLYNNEEFRREINASLNKKISVAVLDIDHFKMINDTYGHKTGDEVIIRIAGILRNNLEGKGIAYRFGGEEFAVIFIDLDENEAFEIMERIRNIVQYQRYDLIGNEGVTISVGITEGRPESDTYEDLFERADLAMYRSKKKGRNTTTIFG